MRKGTISLNKKVFVRLLIITLAAVLVFYFLGVAINNIGIRNLRTGLQRTLESNASYIAGEVNRLFENLYFFAEETAADKQLLRYALTYSVMNDYTRTSYIKSLSEKEYVIKRFSPIVESVQIFLPAIGKTIISDKTSFVPIDQGVFNELILLCEKGRIRLIEWNDKLWVLLPRYDRSEPLFIVAIAISPELLSSQLVLICGERSDGLVTLRADGSIFSALKAGTALNERYESAASAQDFMVAESNIPSIGFSVRCFLEIDEMVEPYLNYRVILWLLTALTLLLFAVYLLYYRFYIMRPLNEIFALMRKAENDGEYRMTKTGGSDMKDIYVQFNDMMDHIQQLAKKVYEEEYRAQKAELSQLQMQINPHFLYNTLYMIYRIAKSEGNQVIAMISENLSSYYRYITKMPEQIVPLRDEVNHVFNYVKIQSFRFSPRIQTMMEPLPDEIADERVPSLFLQPLVENAFVHGVRDVPEGGLIKIGYQVNASSFRIVVSDNGGKIDPGRAEALMEALGKDTALDSGALKNLYRRLELHYGREYGLRLESENNSLKATLIFPRKGPSA